MIKFLKWDSSFFNKRIGELEFGKTGYSFIDANYFDLLYVKQREELLLNVEGFVQTYVETKVVFSKIITKNTDLKDEFVTSEFDKEDDKQQLYELAFESGKFSRFNLDENFLRSEFEALYRKWIDNSLTKDLADDIILYKQGDSILGFVTYKVFGNYATIGLLAIKSKSQGKGIGRKLLVGVENELNKKRIKELRIPTQLKNEEACSFYAKMDYTIIEKIIIKHYWKI